jgi:hypothetical protein
VPTIEIVARSAVADGDREQEQNDQPKDARRLLVVVRWAWGVLRRSPWGGQDVARAPPQASGVVPMTASFDVGEQRGVVQLGWPSLTRVVNIWLTRAVTKAPRRTSVR